MHLNCAIILRKLGIPQDPIRVGEIWSIKNSLKQVHINQTNAVSEINAFDLEILIGKKFEHVRKLNIRILHTVPQHDA